MAKTKYYIQYIQTRGGITPDLQCAKIEATEEDYETLLEHSHVISAVELPMNTPVGEVVFGKILNKDGEAVGTYTPKLVEVVEPVEVVEEVVEDKKGIFKGKNKK